jgi:hypothetical protein
MHAIFDYVAIFRPQNDNGVCQPSVKDVFIGLPFPFCCAASFAAFLLECNNGPLGTDTFLPDTFLP